jgi:hypothetical protein
MIIAFADANRPMNLGLEVSKHKQNLVWKEFIF